LIRPAGEAASGGEPQAPEADIDWTRFHASTGVSEDPDDRDPLWQVACRYQELKAQAHTTLEIARVRKIAVQGILRRTLKLIRHFRRKTRLMREAWREGAAGEIALVETLERVGGAADIRPEDLVVEVREEKPLDLVMLIDTSLSMTGQKLALCAVGAAVLSFRLRAEAFALIAFGSTAKVLKPMGLKLAAEQTIERILDAPILGYTNIWAGLERGVQELHKGRSPAKVGVLLSDGHYNEGEDPEAIAGRYRRLEVMMTVEAYVDYAVSERHRKDLDCCERMARAGRGRVTEVRRYRHLPERLLGVIRSLQR
jgi:Mg-chelatase subunit ChlD